ncbi:alpha-ketoglutaric semialdehyde dehydrogenase GucD [Cohnella silvisoli]|uniref:Aldehyde dehydrogenase family protein n=1 Tax=Cohnella silvisoli TaxID=2873699 RepID=A0ABV1KPD9_9BACL|nr:alpha-ketoglutaric semialdehyde dehydrogenase GucD [Cohnella silvisoli]MCD9020337.1 aldehyde dehydrogenase family protein [Cohnella silvisoli]
MTVNTESRSFGNYIGGKWVVSASGNTEASINPADRNEIVGYCQMSGKEDLDRAVASAQGAALAWRKLSAPARGDFLFKAANILESRLNDIAETMTREMGKTLPEARGETARGVAILRYYAGEGLRKNGDVIPSTDPDGLMFTTRAPLGVVGLITPWNFPVAIPIWKIAPALIYGNTIVFKPAQNTAITAAKIIECFAAAGLPDGVLNLVTGSGSVIGQGIIDHPDIAGISFTGSDGVGKRVALGAVARGAKYQLEMGGKNPVIVCDDADLDLAVDATISGGLKSTGQKCTCTSRVIVMSGVYESFKEKLLHKVRQIKVGPGMSSDTWMGPCASESQMQTVLSYIEKGTAEGATLFHGGERVQGEGFQQGFYVQPTLFENVKPEMVIAQEEIFGPVLALLKVDTLEEALEVANGSRYGLSASVFTRDIGSAMTFIREMNAGLVRINAESAGVELQAPFGGMKQSSSGSREQGQAAIEFYTSIKTVFMKA